MTKTKQDRINDGLLKKIAELRKGHNSLVERHHKDMVTMSARIAALEANSKKRPLVIDHGDGGFTVELNDGSTAVHQSPFANSHPQRVEVEPAFKRDDLAVFNKTGGPFEHGAVLRVTCGHPKFPAVKLASDNAIDAGVCVFASDLRRMSEEEITLYKQEVEWAKVSELQEGDACDIEHKHEFLFAMRDLGLPTGAERTLNGDGDCTVLQWANHRLYRIARTTSPMLNTAEFLRRAKGTALKLGKKKTTDRIEELKKEIAELEATL